MKTRRGFLPAGPISLSATTATGTSAASRSVASNVRHIVRNRDDSMTTRSDQARLSVMAIAQWRAAPRSLPHTIAMDIAQWVEAVTIAGVQEK
jgi:hypothetical protein